GIRHVKVGHRQTPHTQNPSSGELGFLHCARGSRDFLPVSMKNPPVAWRVFLLPFDRDAYSPTHLPCFS
ncbi:hypothetical protein, partial [Chromobacterium violaceum]|uniref:hypothetical protein n=1 Tax=Chromobacterium violaceum TaxID=536 RepID=UPI001B341954